MLANAWYDLCKKNTSFHPILFHYKKIKLKKTYTIVNYLNSKDIKKKLEKLNVEAIIHTAGLASVEKCEKNKKEAIKSNYSITKSLVKSISNKNIKFIYISTDHLFDGKKIKEGYTEKCKTKPLNYYAKTKLMSERYIKKNYSNHLIIRSNFFGKGSKFKKSFSDNIIFNLKKKRELNLFTDVYFNPVAMPELVRTSMRLLKKDKKGIFNISTNKAVSKYTFGRRLAKFKGLNENLIKPIFLKSLNLTKRPLSMYIKNNKIKKILRFNSSLERNFAIGT